MTNSDIKLMVNETAIMISSDWKKVEKLMSINDIYKLFEENKVVSVENEHLVKSTFVEKYVGDLSVENKLQIIVKTAMKRIEKVYENLNLDALKPIKLMELDRNTAGEYFNKQIEINTKHVALIENNYKLNKMISTVIHEIGHFIHDYYFENIQFRFPTEGRSTYSKIDHLENFAEAFMDKINRPYGLSIEKRNDRIHRLISPL